MCVSGCVGVGSQNLYLAIVFYRLLVIQVLRRRVGAHKHALHPSLFPWSIKVKCHGRVKKCTTHQWCITLSSLLKKPSSYNPEQCFKRLWNFRQQYNTDISFRLIAFHPSTRIPILVVAKDVSHGNSHAQIPSSQCCQPSRPLSLSLSVLPWKRIPSLYCQGGKGREASIPGGPALATTRPVNQWKRAAWPSRFSKSPSFFLTFYFLVNSAYGIRCTKMWLRLTFMHFPLLLMVLMDLLLD